MPELPHDADQAATLAAIRQLLQPLARFALARGLTYPVLDEAIRLALVTEARGALGDSPGHGLVSRVSTATGLTRREVGRLLAVNPEQAQQPQSLASEVFARWVTDPAYRHRGRPKPLARTGPSPSFETLAQAVTTDVHPRSILEELTRLQLAQWDKPSDTISLRQDAFVPHEDLARMLSLLADNVGDHLHAAVDNVLGHGDTHFEQAVFADELSLESIHALRPLINAQWAELLGRFGPVLEQSLADDRAKARTQNQRIRIGFFSYTAPMPHAPAANPPAAGDDA